MLLIYCFNGSFLPYIVNLFEKNSRCLGIIIGSKISIFLFFLGVQNPILIQNKEVKPCKMRYFCIACDNAAATLKSLGLCIYLPRHIMLYYARFYIIPFNTWRYNDRACVLDPGNYRSSFYIGIYMVWNLFTTINCS